MFLLKLFHVPHASYWTVCACDWNLKDPFQKVQISTVTEPYLLFERNPQLLLYLILMISHGPNGEFIQTELRGRTSTTQGEHY